jgi:hypothetical protein
MYRLSYSKSLHTVKGELPVASFVFVNFFLKICGGRPVACVACNRMYLL